jgi:hypothetical protein
VDDAASWIAPNELLTTGAPNTPSMPPAAHARLAIEGELNVADTAFTSLLVPSALKGAPLPSLPSPHPARTRAVPAANQRVRSGT